jgi:hypothetical protein
MSSLPQSFLPVAPSRQNTDAIDEPHESIYLRPTPFESA